MFVRTDLSSAQQAVQACHAAMEAVRNHLSETDEHPHLVLLAVKNEAKLWKTAFRLTDEDVQFEIFREPDQDNKAIALATQPVSGQVRQIFKKYQLFGG